MPPWSPQLVLAATLVVAVYLVFAADSAKAVDLDSKRVNPWQSKEFTRDEVLPALEEAGQYLLRNQLSDGQFVYIKDPLGKCCGTKGDRYSLIRHLGAVYALMRTYELTHDDTYLAGARLGLLFAARFVDPTEGYIKGAHGHPSLGENGFLLIDGLLLDYLSGETQFGKRADSLARFLAHNLRYNGPYSTKGQWAECQAAIGLAFYHRLRRADQSMLDAARAWLKASARDGKFSHWSAQAVWWVEKAQPSTDDLLTSYTLAAGRRLVDGVLTADGGQNSQFVGSRDGKLSSCGATARNEGLLACHLLARLKGRDADAHFFRDRAREHLAFAMQFQYGQKASLFSNDPFMTRVASLFDLRGGVFNTPKQTYVRIDYVSHHIRALWAWLSSPGVPINAGISFQDLMETSAALPSKPITY